jgi:outer membrane lipoprotein-sorting protein
MDIVLKDLEKFTRDRASALTIVCLKEDNILYIIDPEEQTKFDFQDKYKVNLNALAIYLKIIIKKKKPHFLESVVLSFDDNIKYEYVFHIVEAYGNAVMEVTGRYERIYFQFAGAPLIR